MKSSVGKREFLLHASKYLHWVEETQQELVVTHQNKPALRLLPISPRKASSLRGFLTTAPTTEDINTPVLPSFDTW